MTLSEFLPLLNGVSGSGGQYSAKCPAHEDKKASLSVSESQDGNILLNCHAGCQPETILKKMGLKMSDLFQKSQQAAQGTFSGKRKVIAEYVYTDLNGAPVAKKLRYPDKGFCWLSPDGKGGWDKGRNGQVPLYNCYNVRDKKTLFIVEGEKDVQTLSGYGKPAVSLPDGAKSKWLDSYTEFLKGRNVAIIQDNDEPGKNLAQMIAGKLDGQAKSVRVIDLSEIWADIPEKADISDYLAAGHDIKKLSELANKTEVWKEKNKWDDYKIISAPDLQKADLPPVKFLVNDILPEGTSLIAAPSKIGKSWFVLDMGLSIASGRTFLSHSTNKNGVLYLALEDSEARLQDRMNKILAGNPPPQFFYFMTKAPNLDDGLIDMLEYRISVNPEIKLIIIDTLQKIRGQALRNESGYAQDYREMGVIKDFADKHSISTFFVHHTRKMKDEDDPFNMISGTNGIMGAADTAYALIKEKREDENAVLHVTGRDVAQTNDLITFNKEEWKWKRLGNADWIAQQNEKLEFEQNPIVKTIRYAVESSENGWWSGKASELLELGEFVTGGSIADSPQKIGYALKKLESKLMEYGNIRMDISKNGSGGKSYSFHDETPLSDVCV